MTILQAVILGIIQGLTEFIPVSSSGHLTLAQSLMGIEQTDISFEVFVHLGTLVPVFVVFWGEIFELIKRPFQKTTLLLILGTIPAVAAVLFFGDLIDMAFASTIFLAVGFAITGTCLLLSDQISRLKSQKDMDHVTPADALIIGCIQAVAIIPGISRSGSTICGSLFRGLKRETAARFSFLLSIPAILGALVYQLKDLLTGEVVISSANIPPMVAGFLAAALSGYLAVNFTLKLVKESKLKFFAFYVFALALGVFVRFVLMA